MKSDERNFVENVAGWMLAAFAWLFAPVAVWWALAAFGFGPKFTLNSYLAVWFLLVCLHLLIARAAATGWTSAAQAWRDNLEYEVANEIFRENVKQARTQSRPDLN